MEPMNLFAGPLIRYSFLALIVIGAHDMGSSFAPEPNWLVAPAQDIPIDQSAISTNSEVDLLAPDWAQRGDYTEGNDTFLVAQTDRHFTTHVEADAALDQVIRDKIQNHIEQQMGHALPRLQIADDDISSKLIVPGRRIVKHYDEKYSPELIERYEGLDHESYYRAFAQIKLDESFLATISHQVQHQSIRDRLRLTALFGFALLALLSVLFGYLRIDHATRGFYNRRLQTFGILLAAAIAAAVFWGAWWLP